MHTDPGDTGAKAFGVNEATQAKFMIGLDESCDGMMKVLATTTKEEHVESSFSTTASIWSGRSIGLG
jgi:hypothetical protein